MSPALPGMLQKPTRGNAGIHQDQHIATHGVQEVVRPMHFRDIIAAHLQADHGMTATLGQQATAYLRIGARAVLIAAARHPAATLAAVSAVLKTVPSIALSRYGPK